MTRKRWFILLVSLIILGVMFFFIIKFLDNADKKNRQDMIETVKQTDIGGVTLLQGIQGYFGETGSWYATSDTVWLEVGNWYDNDDGHNLKASFAINNQTHDVDLLTMEFDWEPVAPEVVDELINDICLAAQR